MKTLADTHVLIWMLRDEGLSEYARDILGNPDNTIYFSMVSVWEILLKHMSHPDNMSFTSQDFADRCMQSGFIPLDGKIEHVHKVASLKRRNGSVAHNDPFDRLLLAQAMAEDMTFVTHDSKIADYECDSDKIILI